MKKIKTLVLIICLSLAVVFAFSCAGADNAPEGGGIDKTEGGVDTASGEDAEREEYINPIPENLPGSDFGGYEFRILTRDTPHHSMYIDSEEQNGEPVNDAVYKRNQIVGETYNVKIKSVQISEFNGPGGEMYLSDTLKKTIDAGLDEYDLAMVHMINAGTLAAKKYFLDWKQIPYIDLTKPWWDRGAAEGLVINGRLYLNSGDFDLDCTDFTWGMIFNKKLWQDFGYEDLYTVVKEGKWTLDYFSGVIKQSSKDLNGDGIYDENDQFGFIAIDRGGLTNFMYGSNERVYGQNASGGFDFVLNNERMQTVVDKTYDIYFNNNSTYVFREPPGSYKPEEEPMDMFMDNKGLTASARLAAMPVLRGMEIDFGIIPQPKFDEAQNGYYTYSDGHASMMCIPATVPDPDRFGIVMEALAYSSRILVLPAYYDVSLNTKFTRDEESSEMIDIIIKNRIFDIGYVYNNDTGTLGFIINDLIKAKKTDFSSTIEKKEAPALKALEKLIGNFE
jgi:hypothetical protein